VKIEVPRLGKKQSCLSSGMGHSGVSAPSSPGELREYLGRWDKASKLARERMLAEFVKNSRNMTGPELEREFGVNVHTQQNKQHTQPHGICEG